MTTVIGIAILAIYFITLVWATRQMWNRSQAIMAMDEAEEALVKEALGEEDAMYKNDLASQEED